MKRDHVGGFGRLSKCVEKIQMIQKSEDIFDGRCAGIDNCREVKEKRRMESRKKAILCGVLVFLSHLGSIVMNVTSSVQGSGCCRLSHLQTRQSFSSMVIYKTCTK
jgi:hypothetical protein